jgi:Deoxycytidylate deaminase
MSVITPRYWMQIAFDVSSAATCLRRSVGAVLVRNNRLLTSGFNGAPSGQTDCLEAGCDMHYDPTVEHDRCRRAKHAEENVIATAARYGINADGAEMYVTFKPCSSCLGLMINAGIKSVFYLSVPDGRAYAEVCKIHDIASAADQIDALGMFMSMPPA